MTTSSSPTRYLRQRRGFLALVLVVTTVCAAGAAADFASAQGRLLGTVRVVNPTPVQVRIYTRNINFYGAQQWVFVAVVKPRSFVYLPRVPNGQWFGIQLQNGQSLPPWQVVYPNPYQPFFEYRVP